MAVSLASFFAPHIHKANGDLGESYRLYTYLSGTTTHQNVFTDSAGATPHTYTSDGVGGQYIALNARGELPANLYLTNGVVYDLLVKTDAGASVWTRKAVGVDSNTDDLRADLADTATASLGSGMIGYDRDLAYATDTIGRAMQSQVRSVFEFMTPAQVTDVTSRAASVDVTAAIQTAMESISTSTVGSFELYFPDGTYSITNTGDRILSIPRGIKLRGSSLEGTRFKVASGSTATCVLEDDGSAAKTEVNNFTIDVNSNASATCGLRLGKRTTQFGTYGTIDNLMVRGSSHASFVAYDLDVNIVIAGKLYTLNATGDALLADDGGSGLNVQAITPLGWTGYGVSMAGGDVVNFAEFEAPGSDDAIAAKFSRGGTLQSWVLSIQSGRTLKTMFQVDPTYVDDFYLGPGKIFREGAATPANTARWGDTTSPADSGTATSGGGTTLTDTSKTWGIDQWRGGMLHITGGTGSGQALVVISNTRHTITTANWTTAPDNTSQYKLDYAVKKVGGGGYAFSESGTAYWPAYYNISVSNQARMQTVIASTVTARLRATEIVAPTIASASTIAPTAEVSFVSGTTTIQTITAPSPISSTGGTIVLIPTGLWSTGTSGNIAIATTAVVSKALHMTYDATTTKWYPSY